MFRFDYQGQPRGGSLGWFVRQMSGRALEANRFTERCREVCERVGVEAESPADRYPQASQGAMAEKSAVGVRTKGYPNRETCTFVESAQKIST